MPPDVAQLEARLQAVGPGAEHARARVDALGALAWELRSTDHVRGYHLATEARELAIEIGHKQGQALAARVLAMTTGRLSGGMREMLAYGEEAKELYDAVGHRVGSAGARDFLASLYEAMGDFSTSMELAQEALSLAREAEHPVRQGYALSNIGALLALKGDADAAFERLREALALFEGAGDDSGVQRICERLGRFCCDTDRMDEALAYGERWLDLSRKRDDTFASAAALALLGELREKQGDLAEAERLYRESVGACDHEQPRSLLDVPAQVALARLLARRGELAEARAGLAEALERSRRLQFAWVDEAPAREALAEVCALEGDWKQANEHLRAVIELERKKAEKETRDQLAQFEVRAEAKAAKQEAEIQRLRYVELSQMQAKLVEAEKMAQLGMIAAGTAHELNTPLGVLRSNLGVYAKAAELLAQPTTPAGDPRAERLNAALAACQRTSQDAIARIAGVADNFRRFTQLDLAERRSFDVNEGLQSALSLLGPDVREGVRLESRLEPVPEIDGWPAALNQAFMTVLHNAIEAIQGEGVVMVQSEATPAAVVVRIRDTGRGMTDEQRERLFDVAWSAEGSRTKMRLGLLAVYSTVERHGGSVEVDSAEGSGTTFTFSFPLDASAA